MIKKTSKAKKVTSKSSSRKKLTVTSRANDLKNDPFYFFKFKDSTNKLIEDVADMLIEWMNKNQANTVLAKFFDEYNIPDERFYEWMRQPRGQRLKHAFNLYKQKLAVTREQGINLNQLNFKAIAFNQHQYAAKWKEAAEFNANLNKLKDSSVDEMKEELAKILKSINYDKK